MKILIYGDYFRWKSGYAREIRDILELLKEGGKNEIRQVALDYNGYPINKDEYIYHTKTPDVKDRYAQEVLHFALDDFKPDIVLTVQDFWMLPKISFVLAHPGPWKWVHWGTLDSDPLDFYCRESLKWMHYCFFQSHHAAIEVKSKVPSLMGEVIYPSVDLKIFNQLDKEKLKKEFKLEGFNVLICNSRGQQRKNVPVLLDAFKEVVNEIPNTALILSSGILRAKTDDDKLDGYDISRFVEELDLTGHVLMPRTMQGGPIDDKTLNIQYNLADLNILASWGEGFGLPFIEAGISGVPSIGVDHSAVHEVVKNRGLLVEPKAYAYNTDGSKYHLCHPKDLKEAIVKLLKDDKLRKQYGDEAQKFAKELTPKSRAEQMLKAFKKLIKDNAQPAARR
jgi:glycosyltransferase involved in cell wall biosynthesis